MVALSPCIHNNRKTPRNIYLMLCVYLCLYACCNIQVKINFDGISSKKKNVRKNGGKRKLMKR